MQIGRIANATVSAAGFNALPLQYRWVVLSFPSSPSGIPAQSDPVPFTRLAQNNTGGSLTWMPPAVPGIYRLQVWVSDGGGKVSTATIAFTAALFLAPVSIYTTGDTYVSDGNSTSINFGGSSVLLSVQQPTMGNNSYPYLAFSTVPIWPVRTHLHAPPTTLPSRSRLPARSQHERRAPQLRSHPAASLSPTPSPFRLTHIHPSLTPSLLRPPQFNVTPSRVTLNVFLLGSQALPTGIRGVNAFLIPPDAPAWNEATLVYRTSACTPSSNTPMPGLCQTQAGRNTAIANTVPGTVYTAPGAEQPPGLQAMGNYLQWDVTGATAPLIAQGAPISFALTNDMASNAVNAGIRFASRDSPGLVRAPFLTMEWPNQMVAQSFFMADTGDARVHTAAVASAVGARIGGTGGTTTASVLGYTVTASFSFSGASAAAFDDGAASALANGLSADLAVNPSNIRVAPALPLVIARRRSLRGILTPGVEVTVVVSGLQGPPGGTWQQSGQAQANATAEMVNSLVLAGNSNAAAQLRAAGYDFGLMGQSQPPVVWREVSVQTPITPFGAVADSQALQGYISSGGLKRDLAKAMILTDIGPLDGLPRLSADVQALLAQISPYSRGTESSTLAAAVAPLISAYGLVLLSPPPAGGGGGGGGGTGVPVPIVVPVLPPNGGGGGGGGSGNSSDVVVTLQGASSASVTASVNAIVVVAIAAIFLSGAAFFVASGALMQAAGQPHSDGARLTRVEAVLLGKARTAGLKLSVPALGPTVFQTRLSLFCRDS